MNFAAYTFACKWRQYSTKTRVAHFQRDGCNCDMEFFKFKLITNDASTITASDMTILSTELVLYDHLFSINVIRSLPTVYSYVPSAQLQTTTEYDTAWRLVWASPAAWPLAKSASKYAQHAQGTESTGASVQRMRISAILHIVRPIITQSLKSRFQVAGALCRDGSVDQHVFMLGFQLRITFVLSSGQHPCVKG